jgi:hypothetical protein
VLAQADDDDEGEEDEDAWMVRMTSGTLAADDDSDAEEEEDEESEDNDDEEEEDSDEARRLERERANPLAFLEPKPTQVSAPPVGAMGAPVAAAARRRRARPYSHPSRQVADEVNRLARALALSDSDDEDDDNEEEEEEEEEEEQEEPRSGAAVYDLLMADFARAAAAHGVPPAHKHRPVQRHSHARSQQQQQQQQRRRRRHQDISEDEDDGRDFIPLAAQTPHAQPRGRPLRDTARDRPRHDDARRSAADVAEGLDRIQRKLHAFVTAPTALEYVHCAQPPPCPHREKRVRGLLHAQFVPLSLCACLRCPLIGGSGAGTGRRWARTAGTRGTGCM